MTELFYTMKMYIIFTVQMYGKAIGQIVNKLQALFKLAKKHIIN